MGFTHEHEFWTSDSEYEELAREYEENIEITHPDYVTSNRLSPYSIGTFWTGSVVKYYEYRGPSI